MQKKEERMDIAEVLARRRPQRIAKRAMDIVLSAAALAVLWPLLLLNTALTVRESMPNSHKGKGWEIFTDRVIALLNERKKPMVFILWGANARAKTALITNPDHLILEGAHPSPLSAHSGFFGGRYFSIANRFLSLTGQNEIDWKLA